MAGELTGKGALVTGASRGIGRAIALRLAQAGCGLLLTGRDVAALAETAQAAAKVSPRVFGHAADLADLSTPGALVERAGREFGRLDIVVANAGATRQGTVTELTDADWETGLGTKFLGHVRLARAAWPLLVESQGAWLAIAGTSSRTPRANTIMTASVNNAVIAATKALSDQGLADGVRVNCLNPGWVETRRYQQRLRALMEQTGVDEDAARREFVRQGFPSCLPEEVAELALFVLAGTGRFFQGATLDFDGGMTAGI